MYNFEVTLSFGGVHHKIHISARNTTEAEKFAKAQYPGALVLHAYYH
tara:strand:+ start:7221 stop:7361 length:141 start_codon:yes stop_codon:yes gene_type:complete